MKKIKTTKRTVWLVTDGDYSDFRIIGVCSTKVLAERARALTRADKQVEPWEIDAIPNAVPEGYCVWRICMDADGNLKDPPFREFDFMAPLRPPRCFTEILGPGMLKTWGDFLIVARTAKQAVKSANEKRIRMIANYEWQE